MEGRVIDNEYVLNLLLSEFEQDILNSYEPDGILTIEINTKSLLAIVNYIKECEIKIDFLTDLCGIHYPMHKGNELGMIYHFHSFTNNFRLRIKTYFSSVNPVVDSLTSIYESSNWQEREAFDFYGIKFRGHPNLKRIMNLDDMEYHPLLKQYRLEDTTREDKDDKMFGR